MPVVCFEIVALGETLRGVLSAWTHAFEFCLHIEAIMVVHEKLSQHRSSCKPYLQIAAVGIRVITTPVRCSVFVLSLSSGLDQVTNQSQ